MANRSAKNGEFVSDEEAAANPDTTVTESTKSKSEQRREAVQAEAKPKSSNRYFETPIDGLKLLVKDNNSEGGNDPDFLEYVQVERYTKMFRGDRVRVGLFVVTSDTPKRAVELLENDGNVTELTEEAYNNLVNDSETRKVA